MTNGSREEIERLANYTAHDIWHDLTIEGTKRKIFEVILTQVEKARADERERCAKICDEWERNGPTHNDKFVARQLGKQIRNKPEKE